MVPEVADWGEKRGTVVLWGGTVSNLGATRALIAAAAGQGVAPDHCLGTGDLCAYCAHPVEVVAEIRAWGAPTIAGNCERQLGAQAADCGCGFGAGSACDLLSAGWYGFASARIGQADRDWMNGLPDFAVFTHEGRRWGVVHGGATAINRFLWPSDPVAAFEAEFAAFTALAGPVDGIVSGHAGLCFERDIGGRPWVNAGSVGLPPHDGRAETRFATLSSDGIRYHRLAYDCGAEARAMASAGLPGGYGAALTSGIWPSEDVLPPELRRQA